MAGEGGGTSIWIIIAMLVLFSVFYVYALGPFTFVTSNVVASSTSGQDVGLWGWFVAFFPYLILLGFILVGVMWPIFSG
jgi:hypothetical protein